MEGCIQEDSYFQCNVLQQELKNDARAYDEAERTDASTMTVTVERQGRSVKDTGLGDIIYKHGWLGKVGEHRARFEKPRSSRRRHIN